MTRSDTIIADAADLRVAVLGSRYHTEITDALEKGARSAFEAAGGAPGMLEVFDSPGAFELAGLASEFTAATIQETSQPVIQKRLEKMPAK